MAHYFENGFFVKEPAWHGLGKMLSGYPTIDAAYELSGHNFTVLNAPCYDEHGTELPNYIRRLIRTDTDATIGKCAAGYKPVQNTELYNFMRVLHAEDEQIKLDTAGVLKGGQYVWVLALANESSPAGDNVQQYLLAYNQHNAGASLRIQMTNVRVQCWNTLSLAMREAENVICIRHTGNVQAQIEQAKMIIKTSKLYAKQFDELIELLDGHPAAYDFVERVTFKVWPKPEGKKIRDINERHRAGVIEIFKRYCVINAERAAGATLWGAVNAFTHYVDHQMSQRYSFARTQKAKAAVAQATERRFQSTMLGLGMNLKQQALTAVCEEAYSAYGNKEFSDGLSEMFDGLQLN